MDDEHECKREVPGRADESISAWSSQPQCEIAWMQVRMCWQSVKRTRLDQEKKDAITRILRYYRETGQPDRPRFEFEQVLLRLEEEHDYRLKELARGQRRSAKIENTRIQVIRDNNDAWMQECRDKAEETPGIIAEWKELMDVLFHRPDAVADVLNEEPEHILP